MPDDSLSEMPEFSKPNESEPIVIIPDATPAKRHCAEKNKEGNPCKVPPMKDSEYCLGHAKRLKLWSHKPGIKGVRAPRGETARYKSREEILAMLSKRLDLVDERFGQICNPEVEQMICDICRTIALVMKVEVSEDVAIKGWRIGRTG